MFLLTNTVSRLCNIQEGPITNKTAFMISHSSLLLSNPNNGNNVFTCGCGWLWRRLKTWYLLQSAQWGEGTMGSTFLKAIYREYTDDTFMERKPQLQASNGLAGPTLFAEVGDLITVVFQVGLHVLWVRMISHLHNVSKALCKSFRYSQLWGAAVCHGITCSDLCMHMTTSKKTAAV